MFPSWFYQTLPFIDNVYTLVFTVIQNSLYLTSNSIILLALFLAAEISIDVGETGGCLCLDSTIRADVLI